MLPPHPLPFRYPKELLNIVAAKEDLIYKALQVDRRREAHYCRRIEPQFLSELNRQKPRTMEQLKRIWYAGEDRSHTHYDHSRYHCLNLHSVFQKGTVEFRAFNGAIHAGKVKGYIQFCLGITAQALNQRCATPERTVSGNDKYTFRVWLLRLGMIGEEFKTARGHLLGHLEGNIAWRDPQQAQRLQAKRAQSTATAASEVPEMGSGGIVPVSEPLAEVQQHPQNTWLTPEMGGYNDADLIRSLRQQSEHGPDAPSLS